LFLQQRAATLQYGNRQNFLRVGMDKV